MNRVKDEEIMKYIDDMYNDIILNTDISDKSIIGLFGIGKAIHGFAETLDDVTLILCYMPTKEEMRLNTFKYKYGEKYKNIKITDFRYVYDLLKKQDLDIMECIFTEYKIINPKYSNEFYNEIYLNRETLFRYSIKSRIENATSRGCVAIQRYSKNNDINYLYEACRIRIACKLMLTGASIENCINLKMKIHTDYLKSILDAEIEPEISQIEDDLREIEEFAQHIQDNENTLEMIKNMINKFYDIAEIEVIDFKSLLTKSEKSAFNIIKDNINGKDGCISVAKLTNESGISRTAFTGVFQKMKEHRVAEVINKGVKGMYVNFINLDILE